MQRGEIWLAELDPARGSEADRTRPVVIVSNDRYNRTVEVLRQGVVTVVPLTSAAERIWPFQVAVEPEESGLSAVSKAQGEQIRAIDHARLVRRLGRLAPERLRELDEAIALHLSLS